jgi:hypothetical protein
LAFSKASNQLRPPDKVDGWYQGNKKGKTVSRYNATKKLSVSSAVERLVDVLSFPIISARMGDSGVESAEI